MTWKFRYRRDSLGDAELVERLNALGEAGWSLLGPPQWVPGDRRQSAAGTWRCFLRRTVSTREQLRDGFSLRPEEGDGAP